MWTFNGVDHFYDQSGLTAIHVGAEKMGTTRSDLMMTLTLDFWGFGGAGQDTITGSAGDNFIDGGSQNDILTGGSGTNTIDGGEGLDTINAGPGANAIDGGSDGAEVFINGTDGR